MREKSKYDPKIHHRRSIRLKGYDYSRAGAYFITICCANRECHFGFVEDDKTVLNDFGKIAHMEWIRLAERFPQFQLDAFQIMPNHMHAIIVLDDPVGTTLAVTPKSDNAVTPDNASGTDNGGKPCPYGRGYHWCV